MAVIRVYPTRSRLDTVDLSMPVALAALIESRRLTDSERHLYIGFALSRIEAAHQESQRLVQAGTKPAGR